MLKIFISNSVLSDVIYQAEDDSKTSHDLLYKILKSRTTVIYVSEKYPEELPLEVALFCSSYGNFPKEDRCDFLSDILSNPSAVLKEPTSVFLLDVEPCVANDIQEKYGVICLAKEDAYKAGAMLMDDNKEYSTDNNKVFHDGWATVLSGIRQLPSNSLIINDRYLFSNRENSKGEGFKNLRQILQLLLPMKFAERKTGIQYHVLIVFDPEEIYGSQTFQSVVERLFNMITCMRKYTIKLEVLGIAKGMKTDNIHFRLHNRRIVSNYYIVKAEQQLAAFNDTKGTCCQTITPQRFFTEDSLVKETSSSSPQRSIRQLIEVFEDFDPNIHIGSDGYKAYYYAVATNKDDVKGIGKNLMNRLLRKKKSIVEKEL